MLDFEDDYIRWREHKLTYRPCTATLEPTIIHNPAALQESEKERLRRHCSTTNFALYRLENPAIASKSVISTFARQLGMLQFDQNLCADNQQVSSLEVRETGRATGYIPYTNRALNWHTDGYYNPFQQHIRSFLLHCVHNASNGGENIFVDHEIIYIKLYDYDPALITALRQHDALTIPANIEQGMMVRPSQTGPVFYRDPISRSLQMRYTARARNIQWKQDKTLTRALEMIEQLLADQQTVLHYTLQPGEGFICNNILHGRTSFTNGNIPDQKRLLYRIRSYDRLFFTSN